VLESILLVVHVLLAVALIGLVLIQHGRGADVGAAFGAGASGTVFGARGSASFLTRTTAVLATLFFLTSLTLAYLSAHRAEPASVLEKVAPAAGGQAAPAKPKTPAPEEAVPQDLPPVPAKSGGAGGAAGGAKAPADVPADVPTVPASGGGS